jgi:hypothetical protein
LIENRSNGAATNGGGVRTSRLTKDGQSFSSIGSTLIWWLISSGARTRASLKMLRLLLLFSRHLSPTAQTAVTPLLASDRRLPDDRPRQARRRPRNARNAAEIHGFCVAVPEVRIHLPPALSSPRAYALSLDYNRFAQGRSGSRAPVPAVRPVPAWMVSALYPGASISWACSPGPGRPMAIGRAFLGLTAHLRQTGSTPQLNPPKSRRYPRKFHTAV